MSDFFSELGKKFTETADIVGKKTTEILDTEKFKSQIRTLERANERDYIDIGKKIYEKFRENEIKDMDCVELCEAIEKREESIADIQKEIAKIKGE
nr:hypothetical protein [uncultured Sellimonas sp.]